MLAPHRYYFVGTAVFLVLVSCTFLLFRQDEATLYDRIVNVPYRTSSKPSLRDTFLHLFDSIKHDPSEPIYRAPSGDSYTSNTATWTKRLGSRVLIVDIDTRIPTDHNQILNPKTLDFEHLDMHGGGLVSNAIINHYLYALVHGYDYKFFSARSIPDHHDTWILPHVVRELIPDYDFVIVMDADVVVAHLELPLEWLFNRWNISRDTSIALPWDTEELRNNVSISTDSTGLRVLNTGLVIAQNLPTTLDMLDAWRDCTKEERYEGCARWRFEWSHEQRAFSEYIRHDPQFTKNPNSIVPIDCDDAVGWPGFKADVESGNEGISDCNGNFVRHYTLGKDKVKTASSNVVMQAISEVLQKQLLGEKGPWIKEEEKKKKEEKEEEEVKKEEYMSKGEVKEKEEDVSREKVEGEEEKVEEEEVPVILEGMVPGTA